MRERKRQKHQEMVETAQPTTVENFVVMLQEVLKTKASFIRETSTRLVKQMPQNLKNQYLGVLKKKISDALGSSAVTEPAPTTGGIQPCGTILGVNNGDNMLPQN
jgi:hypothetical protein